MDSLGDLLSLLRGKGLEDIQLGLDLVKLSRSHRLLLENAGQSGWITICQQSI